jgi:PKD repeat protein
MKAPLSRCFAVLVTVMCPLAIAQIAVAEPPSADFNISDLVPEVGQSVTFTSAIDPALADGLTFSWTFGDGATGSGPSPSHAYTSPGRKIVTLTVMNSLGESASSSNPLRVNAPPTARFTWTPGTPLIGQTVVFDASRSRDNRRILRYEWDLDGNARSGPQGFEVDRGANTTATASYPTSGARRIRLRVTDDDGVRDVRVSNILANAAPTASFIVSPARPLAGEPITLSSTSGDPDGPLASQRWDLDGDGQYDDGQGPVVTKRLSVGSHVVRLRVTDTPGATASAERRITVLRRPPRMLEGVKVTLFGDLTMTGARLRRLLVRTPAHATVKIHCKGRSCPKGARAASRRTSKTQRLRFKKFERSFRGGTLITVTVTRSGYIGQHTTIKIRSGQRRYIRRDRCVMPAASKPVACPDS